MPNADDNHSDDITIADLDIAYGINPLSLSEEALATARRLAALDFAVDCFLVALYNHDLLSDQGSPIFLGGTVIAKTRLGRGKRASNDLDFNWLRRDNARFMEMLRRGLSCGPFTFTLPNRKTKRGDRLDYILVKSPLFKLGRARLHVDLVSYPRVMAPTPMRIIDSAFPDVIQQPSGNWLPALPVFENVAGKYCRWNHSPNPKDLHDVALLQPVLKGSEVEIAELVTWISAKHQPRPLISSPKIASTAGAGRQIARIHPIEAFNLDQLLFIPDLSEDEKMHLIMQWQRDIAGFTAEVDDIIRSDPRLLSIASRSDGFEPLLHTFDAELHERYGTADNPYRRPELAARNRVQPAPPDAQQS